MHLCLPLVGTCASRWSGQGPSLLKRSREQLAQTSYEGVRQFLFGRGPLRSVEGWSGREH
jgi:hypothetical protein